MLECCARIRPRVWWPGAILEVFAVYLAEDWQSGKVECQTLLDAEVLGPNLPALRSLFRFRMMVQVPDDHSNHVIVRVAMMSVVVQ